MAVGCVNLGHDWPGTRLCSRLRRPDFWAGLDHATKVPFAHLLSTEQPVGCVRCGPQQSTVSGRAPTVGCYVHPHYMRFNGGNGSYLRSLCMWPQLMVVAVLVVSGAISRLGMGRYMYGSYGQEV